MAFQITDDLLDLCGTEKVIGKPPGSDLRQGNITLPVLYALQEEPIREPLLAEIGRIQASEPACYSSAAVRIVRSSSGIAQAEKMADRYISKALRAFQSLPIAGKRTISRILPDLSRNEVTDGGFVVK